MIYIAEVVSGDDWTVPLCLACALAQPPASQCPLKIRVQSNIAELEAVAQSFEVLLRQAVPGGSAGKPHAAMHKFGCSVMLLYTLLCVGALYTATVASARLFMTSSQTCQQVFSNKLLSMRVSTHLDSGWLLFAC